MMTRDGVYRLLCKSLVYLISSFLPNGCAGAVLTSYRNQDLSDSRSVYSRKNSGVQLKAIL